MYNSQFLCKLTLLIYVNIYSSVNPGRVSYCPRSNRPLFHINTEVQLKIEFTCYHVNSPVSIGQGCRKRIFKF